MAAIKFRKRLSKFMIPKALLEKKLLLIIIKIRRIFIYLFIYLQTIDQEGFLLFTFYENQLRFNSIFNSPHVSKYSIQFRHFQTGQKTFLAATSFLNCSTVDL